MTAEAAHHKQAKTERPAKPTPSARREDHPIGYARVSTTGQDTATRKAKLKAVGCTFIPTEAVSGGSRNSRNELASSLDFIRRGDTFIVGPVRPLREEHERRSQPRARTR